MSVEVLTSENAQAFYERKLNLVPEPAAAPNPAKAGEGAAVVESASESTSAAPAAEAGEQQPNPDTSEGKQKVNLRFSELTEKIKAADADAAKARAEAQAERDSRALAEKRAQEASDKAAALEAKLNPPKVVEALGPEPQPGQFTDAFEYAKALAEWSTESALAKRDKEEAEKQSIAAREKVVQTWIERRDATKAEIPGYDAEIAASKVEVSDQVRDAIIESEVGPKILLHLARNPEVAVKLRGLSVGAALKEIGKLEAKIEAAPTVAPAKDAPAVVSSEPSRALAPIKPLRGGGAAVEPLIDEKGEFHGTHAQWKAARQAKKIM